MPQTPTTHLLRTVLLIVIVLAIIGSIVFVAFQQGKEVPPPAPVQTPPPSVPEVVVPQAPPEPARIPEESQSKIDSIVKRLDRGEITREEAQKQVNEILGIEQ